MSVLGTESHVFKSHHPEIIIMTFLFSLFSICSIITGLFVITVRNPVHSVLFLIAVFVNISGLLIILQTDFLAMLFLVVYIGAIAVLFLFIVMMLNIKISEDRKDFFRSMPIGIFFALIIFMEIYLIISSFYERGYENTIENIQSSVITGLSNVEVLGSVLYTQYVYHFILAGFILLIAMIGAIVLTMQYNETKVKHQHIFQQITRNSNRAIFLTKLD